MKSLAFRRAAVLAYCIGIFCLSARRGFPDIMPWYPAWMPDYHLFAHFFLYAGLSFVVWIDFRGETIRWLQRRAMAATVIFCAVYGLTDEFHQTFVPNRVFELADLLMDTLGPAAVMIAIALWRGRDGPGVKDGT